MSHHNPDIQPPILPHPNEAIQPSAPDFVETPDITSVSDERKSIPAWLYIVCGFFLFMTGSSFTGFGIFGQGLYDQGPGGPSLAASKGTEAVVTDPMALGKKVYGNNCANCHQPTGEGQPGSYPPLAGSEWVLGHKERLAAILLKGIQGPLNVKNVCYTSQVMPQQESILTPDKIANLMTYIRGSWGNTAGPVTEEEVTKAKATFASQTSAWTEAALLKIAPHGPDPTDKKP